MVWAADVQGGKVTFLVEPAVGMNRFGRARCETLAKLLR